MLSQGTSESDLVSQMEQVFDEKITQVHYITVEAVSEGFATISYVDNAISLISGGSFDPSVLNDFATKTYVNDNYYDKGTVDNKISKVSVPADIECESINCTGDFECSAIYADNENVIVRSYLNCENTGAYFSEDVSMDSDLVVNGSINCPRYNVKDQIFFDKGISDFARIRFTGEDEISELEIATSDDTFEEIVCRQYKWDGTAKDKYWSKIHRTLKLLDASGNTIIPGDLSVSGNISASNIYTKIEIDKKLSEVDIPADIECESINCTGDFECGAIHANDENVLVRSFLNCENTGAYFSEDVSMDSDLTVNGKINGYKLAENHNSGSYFWQNVPIIPVVRVDGVMEIGKFIDFHDEDSPNNDNDARLTASKDSSGNPTLCVQFCDLNVDRNLNVFGNFTIASSDDESHKWTLWIDGYGNLMASSSSKTVTLIQRSQTITHSTNVINAEIGTFCETNGGIYDKYSKIDNTDCICQVVPSNTLNAKIVGIVCSENQFASHGDVLVKVVPGTYKLGDILVPDITGKARVATETELQYMMLHAIPRPKITSLDTKIEGVVACFIV